MTKSNPKLFSQIMILVLLVLVIIGFTLPAALDYNSNGQIVVEPRYCKTDSECYLICEDKPVEIFCTQNMCVQNACNEANYYAFNSSALNFELMVMNKTGSLDLGQKSDSKDIFVKFSGKTVSIYSSGITLGQVLEKVGLKIDPTLGNVSVNNQQNYAYSDYVPVEGDKMEVVYS